MARHFAGRIFITAALISILSTPCGVAGIKVNGTSLNGISGDLAAVVISLARPAE